VRALITGITGQDGSYLAELLLEKGYEVHGLVRRCSHAGDGRIAHIRDRIVLHDGDLMDQGSLDRAVRDSRPDEVYNLGGQSFVGSSWTQPALTAEVNGLGALRLLEAVRANAPSAHFYQASSSEMFGNQTRRQDELTAFAPRSPYAAAKVLAHHTAIVYRESYGMHISCGIAYNHESERRGEEFVTRKVCRQIAEIKRGQRERLSLGNLHARRDWGYAPDYVRAMWLMLQQDEPGDYVLATGVTHSVAELVDRAAREAGLSPPACDSDGAMIRPAEVDALSGDASKARFVLGWAPDVSFDELVARMVRAELLGACQPAVMAG